MANRESTDGLREALDFKLSEVLRYDFFLGVAGAIGAVLLAVYAPSALFRALPALAGFVGMVVGAVIAGAAILAAFLDQPFLRKLRAIGRSPTRYLAPFLFSATLGIFAAFPVIVLSALDERSSIPLLAVTAGVGGLLSFWTIGSLLQCLSVLVQFIGLKHDAIDIPDDVDIHRHGSREEPVRRVR